MAIKLKRVYDKLDKADGYRILVDRLWPRGLSKDRAHVDLWLKDIAPTDALRKWFAHDPAKWPGFKNKYQTELKRNSEQLKILKHELRSRKNVTLLFASHDTQRNQAVVLKSLLQSLTRTNMPRYGKGAQKKVKEKMHEMKTGKLKIGKSGKKVKNPKQAIAIGLAEARREGKKVPPKKMKPACPTTRPC